MESLRQKIILSTHEKAFIASTLHTFKKFWIVYKLCLEFESQKPKNKLEKNLSSDVVLEWKNNETKPPFSYYAILNSTVLIEMLKTC